MDLTYLPMLLQQDVNKLYPDIKNHDIIPPPHWNWRVSHTFFLKSRWWLNLSIDFWGDEVIDYLEYDWNKYWLIKDGADLVVKKNDSSTTLLTKWINNNINHRLLLVSSVWGAELDNGTWASSNVNAWVYTITDSTKSWTTNEYAGKFVYIANADTGTWQIFQISSNTGTVLTLNRWWELAPTNITYYIFDSWKEVPAVVTDDGVYVIHNDTSIYKLNNFWIVIDAIYNLWRMIAVDINDNIIVSYSWYNAHFIDNTSIIWTFSWVFAITSFQDFVLLIGNTRLWLVKKETVSVTIDSNQVSIDTFKPLLLTNLLGAFSKNSFRVYNQWLYIYTSAKRFIWLSISPAWTDRYTISQEDQWTYIQQFLDSVAVWDDVSVVINAEKISLVHKTSTLTNIFLYDTYYRFWYRWTTTLPIHGNIVYNNIYYLWDKVYVYDWNIDKDYWNIAYVPKIRVLFGEPDIFSIKNIVSHKMYIGKHTDQNVSITYNAHLNWWKYNVNNSLTTLKYLDDAIIYSQWVWLAWTLLGLWVYWWYGRDAWEYFVSDTNIIEIPTKIVCSLLEIELEWDLEFGGMLLWYHVIDPSITPIDSVLWI